MEKSRVIELIKLDVLDVNIKQDAEALQSLKKNNADFPWEEYGYYQNLVALMAATSSLQIPSPALKKVVLSKVLSYKNVVQPIEKEETAHEVDTEITKQDVHSYEEVVEAAPANNVSVIEHQSREQGRNSSKVRKEPISFREPNYSNIHILFEEKQNKVVREKELQSKIIQEKKEILEKQKESLKKENAILDSHEEVSEKQIQIPDNHTEYPINKNDKENLVTHSIEDKIEIKEENKTLNKLVNEYDLSSSSDNNELYSFTARKWYQKKVLVSSAAVGLIVVSIVSVGLFSSSSDTKGNPVSNSDNKIIVSNIQNNDHQNTQPDLAMVEDAKSTDMKNKSDQQPIIENNKKPRLPEPPKLIEVPITDLTESNDNSKTENAEEVVKEELPVVIPPKEEKKLEEESPYFVAVEEMPAPIGGITSIQSKITYPEIAIRAGVEGKVYILAFVDEVGTVTKAELVKGIGSGCDEAAMDAVLKTKFKPGVQRGKPVKVKITIPIVFKK